jgi:phage baseplate assembly protein V
MLKFGIITGIDAGAGKVRVHFDDDDIVSDWLPITVKNALKNKDSFPLDVKEHVACLMDEHCENGVCLGAIYSKNVKPTGGNKDKWRKVFEDGTVLEYDRSAHKLTVDAKGTVDVKATGAVSVDTDAAATVKATAVTLDAPTVTCTGALTAASISTSGGGDITAAGKITATGDIKTTGGDVENSLSIKLGIHKHLGVTPGGGTTALPTP